MKCAAVHGWVGCLEGAMQAHSTKDVLYLMYNLLTISQYIINIDSRAAGYQAHPLAVGESKHAAEEGVLRVWHK
jgi:hypothetical protein